MLGAIKPQAVNVAAAENVSPINVCGTVFRMNVAGVLRGCVLARNIRQSMRPGVVKNYLRLRRSLPFAIDVGGNDSSIEIGWMK